MKKNNSKEFAKNYGNWTKEELIEEIKKLKKRKKYGVVWEEKSETVVDLCKTKLPVLKEMKDLEINTETDSPTNVIIEGDNYHALSVLNYTHKKSIDLIYIDPPFNTGNRDFTFNDKIVEAEDDYRHSKWLSFMNRRLKLAKNLLTPTGLIFISINDVECPQLRLLCNVIFGESNFVAQLIWKTRVNVDSRSLTGASIDHEYVLVYRKSKKAKLRGREIDKSKYKNPDNDPRGPWMSSPIDGLATKERRPNLHFTIVDPITGKEYNPSPETGWRFEPKTVRRLIMEKRILFPKNPKSKPRVKRYLRELKNKFTGFSTILKADYTSYGTKELRQIMHREAFKFPKPSTFVEQLINQHKKDDAIILDFMAGSGTTGHAVLQLNKRDGGKRKFILCTNNENNICTEVCYPRIKKVIEGFKNSEGTQIDGLGGDLKYFKTSFVDSEPTDLNKKKLVDQSTEMLCLREDCFDEVKSDQYYRIFRNNKGDYLGIVYDDDGITSFKKDIKKMNKTISVYVFSLDTNAREEEFQDLTDLVNLKPIPEVILNVYRRIFK